MVEEARQTDMEIGDYDILPRIMPFHSAWTKQYGNWAAPSTLILPPCVEESVFKISQVWIYYENLANVSRIPIVISIGGEMHKSY